MSFTRFMVKCMMSIGKDANGISDGNSKIVVRLDKPVFSAVHLALVSSDSHFRECHILLTCRQNCGEEDS